VSDVFAIFRPIRHCGLCDFHQLGYSYFQDEAVDRILAVWQNESFTLAF